MDFSLSRSNFVSLTLASICLVLFSFFPTGGSVWEDIACMIAFFLILPALYIIFVLKKSLRELDLEMPQLTSKRIMSGCFALFIGVVCAIGIFFTPYNSDYISSISPVFSSFKGFALYHLIFILPSLLLIGFFCVTFLNTLDLPRLYSLLFGGIAFTFVLTSLYALPLIFGVVFALPFFILWYLRIEHLYFLTLSVFISILTYNTLIAKALLNTKL